MSYGKVHGSFWSDEKIVGLPDDGKLLALYLITGPHRSIVGAMRLPLGYMAADLGWEHDRCRKALAELSAIGFIVRDEASGWTHVRNQLLYDPPQNPNQVKAAIRLAFEITSPMVLASVRERSIAHMRHHGTGYDKQFEQLPNPSPKPSETVPEGLAEPIRNSGSGSGSGSETFHESGSGSQHPAARVAAPHVNGLGIGKHSSLGSVRPSSDGKGAKDNRTRGAP